MTNQPDRPAFAETYDLHPKGLTINGQEFPYLIHVDGPRIEPIDTQHHVLWVPVTVLKPAPETWDDRGQPLEALAAQAEHIAEAIGEVPWDDSDDEEKGQWKRGFRNAKVRAARIAREAGAR